MLHETVAEAEGGGGEGVGGGGVGGRPVASVIPVPLQRKPEHLHHSGTCVEEEGTEGSVNKVAKANVHSPSSCSFSLLVRYPCQTLISN